MVPISTRFSRDGITDAARWSFLESFRRERLSIEKIKAAAESGNVKAQMAMGYCYDVGKDVPQDLSQAAAWYRKAADNGFAPAQFNLAEMYREGAGVDASSEEAFQWYTRAAMQGHAKAMYNIAMMHVTGEGVQQDNVLAYAWLLNCRGGDAEGVEQALEIIGNGIGEKKSDAEAIAADLKSKMTLDSGEQTSP